jgi:glycosyltransferase involved in cell wall biosynthesis
LLTGGSDDGRVELWTRGVDAERFSPLRRDARLRRQWGVSDARPAVLYVGRVSKEKGLHLLPALAQALAQHHAAHRLIIVGQGPMERELKRGLPDAVFTGVLHGDALAAAYASADVFVFPSQTDTAGNVVLEAQASGLPVLVSAVGGPRENMVDGRTGYVVHEPTAEAWLHSLVPLLERASDRAAMSLAARRYAEARTWPRALEPLFRLYRVLGRRAPVSPRSFRTPASGSAVLALPSRVD